MTDLCDIWNPSHTVDGNLKPADVVYALSASGVPCLYGNTINIDKGSDIGLIKEPNSQSMDSIMFPDDTQVFDNSIVVNRSVKCPSGDETSLFGDVHGFTGAPRKITQLGVLIFLATNVLKPPAEIVTYYA